MHEQASAGTGYFLIAIIIMAIGVVCGMSYVWFIQFQKTLRIDKRIKETLTREFVKDKEEEFEQVWTTKSSGQRFFDKKNLLKIFSIVMLTVLVIALANQFSAKNLAMVLIMYMIGMGLIQLSVMIIKSKQNKRFIDHLPVAVEYMLRTIVAGRSIIEAFKLVTESTEGLLRESFQEIVDDVSLGMSLEKAIVRSGEKTEISEFRYFCIIVHIHVLTGGNIAGLFESLVDHLREKKIVDNKIKAISSESKASSYLMSGLPIIALLACTALRYEYMRPLWTTQMGHTVLAACALSELLGIIFVHKITRIEV